MENVKSVLISINPYWCDLIVNGKKGVEVRKNQPSIETPFKCYVYCTKAKNVNKNFWVTDRTGVNHLGNGKVVGEFICDNVFPFSVPFSAYQNQADVTVLNDACMSYSEAHRYLRHKSGYAWHISDLVLYETPKELCEYINLEFRKSWEEYEKCEARFGEFMNVVPPDPRNYSLKRPPQSWCYVNSLED